MGRIAKVHTEKEAKPVAWKPICPKCNRERPVGELCGGTHPKFFCRDCLSEFSVKKVKGVPVSAKVYISTCSGMRVMHESYVFDGETQKFVFVSSKRDDS